MCILVGRLVRDDPQIALPNDERQAHLNSRVVNLQHRRASDNRLITNRLRVNQHNISLAINTGRDSRSIPVTALRRRRKDRSVLRRERSVQALSRGLKVAGWTQLNGGSRDQWIVVAGTQHAVHEREEREDVDEGQLLWALDDVARGDGVRLRWGEWDIERAWEGAALGGRDLLGRVGEERTRVADVRGVARLDGEDAAGLGQIFLGGDEGGGAEVGGYADGFDGGGELEEGLWVGGGEVVGAWRNGLAAEGSLKEVDVSLLVGGDGLKVVVEGLDMLVR